MSKEVIPPLEGLSVAELDQRLEEAVLDHERAEKLICFALLEMHQRKGYEKFGFRDIEDYAHMRFAFSDRRTRYMLSLARRIKDHPLILKALEEGKIGWTKAYRIVKVAKPEDEAMWLETAMSMSVRELDRRIKQKLDDVVTKLRLWLSEDQTAVWEYALEVCRKVSGANLSMEQCLEYMAGEFLATWAFEANKEDSIEPETSPESETTEEDQSAEPQPTLFDSSSEEPSLTKEDIAEIDREIARICPETADLPRPSDIPYSKIARMVLERDHYTCSVPGCSARARLHVHHLECRSHFGKKGRAECHALCNLLVLCALHHRMVHAGIMSVTGKAPFDLKWTMPKLMEAGMLRMERRRQEIAQKEMKRERKGGLPSPVSTESDVSRKTFSENAEPPAVDTWLPIECGTDCVELSSEELYRLLEEYPEMMLDLAPELALGKKTGLLSRICG